MKFYLFTAHEHYRKYQDMLIIHEIEDETLSRYGDILFLKQSAVTKKQMYHMKKYLIKL